MKAGLRYDGGQDVAGLMSNIGALIIRIGFFGHLILKL